MYRLLKSRRVNAFSSFKIRVLFIVVVALFSTLITYIFSPLNISLWLDSISPTGLSSILFLLLVLFSVIIISHTVHHSIFGRGIQSWFTLSIMFLLDIIMVITTLSVIYLDIDNWSEDLFVISRISIPTLILAYVIGLNIISIFNRKGESIEQAQMDKMIEIEDESGRLRLTLSLESIIYFEAADNYVIVYYQSGDGLSKEMVRNTLKNMESKFVPFGYIRCHRSFLVRKDAIEKVCRSSRISEIVVRGAKRTIPISRGIYRVIFDYLEYR